MAPRPRLHRELVRRFRRPCGHGRYKGGLRQVMSSRIHPRTVQARPAICSALLAGTAALALWPCPMRLPELFWNSVLDALHFPVFAAVGLVVHWALPQRHRPLLPHSLFSAGLAALFALLIELVQPLFGRTASLTDLVNGLLGIATGVGGVLVWRLPVRGTWRVVFLWASAGCALSAFFPVFAGAHAALWRQARFPILGDFESDTELRLWRAQGGAEQGGRPTAVRRTDAWATRGKWSLQVQLGEGGWPGVNYAAGDSNWAGHKALRLSVLNPGPPFELCVRIDDDGDCSRQRQRFGRTVSLVKGVNELRILTEEIRSAPAERELDLASIRRVVLVVVGAAAGRTFMLDSVTLE